MAIVFKTHRSPDVKSHIAPEQFQCKVRPISSNVKEKRSHSLFTGYVISVTVVITIFCHLLLFFPPTCMWLSHLWQPSSFVGLLFFVRPKNGEQSKVRSRAFEKLALKKAFNVYVNDNETKFNSFQIYKNCSMLLELTPFH